MGLKSRQQVLQSFDNEFDHSLLYILYDKNTGFMRFYKAVVGEILSSVTEWQTLALGRSGTAASVQLQAEALGCPILSRSLDRNPSCMTLSDDSIPFPSEDTHCISYRLHNLASDE